MERQKATNDATIAATSRANALKRVHPCLEGGPLSCKAPDRGIKQLCRDRGVKMTAHRHIVARVLEDASDHPDVKEVYRRASLLDKSICLATVYRTVRLFEEKCIIQRRNFNSRSARFEVADHGHHYHLIDVENGKVVEFSNATHEWLIQALVEDLGFEIVSLRLEVFGKRLDVQPRLGQPMVGKDVQRRPR